MSLQRSELASEIITTIHKIGNKAFELHPYGGMYWASKKILFVSDTHFGKVTHFRKSGIAVPMGAIEENWDKLNALIDYFNCEQLIVLGDLFHSTENNEWDLFKAFINSYAGIKFTLIIGNHDILDASRYSEAGLEVVESLDVDGIHFSHHPEEVEGKYNIHGHVHPAVLMRAKGIGSKKVGCFYFNEKHGIMPAFGAFTGTMRVNVKEGDAVYLLVGEKVILAET